MGWDNQRNSWTRPGIRYGGTDMVLWTFTNGMMELLPPGVRRRLAGPSSLVEDFQSLGFRIASNMAGGWRVSLSLSTRRVSWQKGDSHTSL